MNPWIILAWVGSISASVLIAVLVISIIVQAVRSLRKPASKPDAQILSSREPR